MKVTYCDRCGEKLPVGGTLQRLRIIDINRGLDLCENCHSDLMRWLDGGKNIVRENIERSN